MAASAVNPDRAGLQEGAKISGPALSLTELYDAHVTMVWRSLKALGVPEAALDDAVQDVFLVVHRRAGEFDARSSLKSWLFGIAYRVAANHRRSLRRRSGCELDPDLPDRGPDPQQQLQHAEATRFVQQFLETLNEPNRAAFTACVLEHMSVAEAAEAFGVNVNTLYSRVRSVRERFMSALAARGIHR